MLYSTPGFINKFTEYADQLGPQDVLRHVYRLLSGPNGEPSAVFGDPDCKKERIDDEGRSVIVPFPFRFYAIRDDYSDGPKITFLLPEEY